MALQPLSPYAIYSTKESGIRAMPDLAGKKVGAQSQDPMRQLFSVLATRNGLQPSAVSWVDRPMRRSPMHSPVARSMLRSIPSCTTISTMKLRWAREHECYGGPIWALQPMGMCSSPTRHCSSNRVICCAGSWLLRNAHGSSAWTDHPPASMRCSRIIRTCDRSHEETLWKLAAKMTVEGYRGRRTDRCFRQHPRSAYVG